MPRARRAHGRPATSVIPTRWPTSHASVVAGTLPTRVLIGPAGTTPEWSSTTKRTISQPIDPVYDGPARLNRLGDSERRVDAADDQVDVQQYAVTLPLEHPGADAVEVGHRITVLAPPDGAPIPADDDPALWGRRLWVVAVTHDAHRFSRQITARLDT